MKRNPALIKGIIFDMDGVVTQTALIHFKAWKVVLDQLLLQIDGSSHKPFTQEEYFNYLDGMTRVDGISNFLTHRNISMDVIKQFYLSLDECIKDICHKKNNMFLSLIASQKVHCFPDTLEFIEFILSHNYAIALISSSKNCVEILNCANIANLFPIRVDGKIAHELGLPSKPHPAIFLEAAKRLELSPKECIVVEDALAGVKAAKEGNFGLVVALDRHSKLHKEFYNLGADYILSDLSSTQLLFYKNIIDKQKQKLQSAFTALPMISNLQKNNKEFIIFLDYDGTLTPIVDRPEKAILPPLMHQCLSQLCQNYITVIMSGRKLSDLKKIINIPNLFYAGNHGFEFEGPANSNMYYEKGLEYFDDLNQVFDRLFKEFSKIKGCILENKKFSLSIHYRLVDEKFHDLISKKIDETLISFPRLVRHYGKKVFEIRPNMLWNKGIAAEYIFNKFKSKKNSLIPLFIGDDVSDEDAFKQFKRNGITIKVSKKVQETEANYFLESPQKVVKFLNDLNHHEGMA